MGRRIKAGRTPRNGRSGYAVQMVLDREDVRTLDDMARASKTTRTGVVRAWLLRERAAVNTGAR